MIEAIGAWIIANMTLNPVFIGWVAIVMVACYLVWGVTIFLKLRKRK